MLSLLSSPIYLEPDESPKWFLPQDQVCLLTSDLHLLAIIWYVIEPELQCKVMVTNKAHVTVQWILMCLTSLHPSLPLAQLTSSPKLPAHQSGLCGNIIIYLADVFLHGDVEPALDSLNGGSIRDVWMDVNVWAEVKTFSLGYISKLSLCYCVAVNITQQTDLGGNCTPPQVPD